MLLLRGVTGRGDVVICGDATPVRTDARPSLRGDARPSLRGDARPSLRGDVARAVALPEDVERGDRGDMGRGEAP